MTSGTRIVFFGNERIATGVNTDVPVLKTLLKNGYDIAAIVTNYEAGKSRRSRQLEIAKVAEEHKIPLLIPDKLSDIKQQLIDYRCPVGVLVAYGKIVPEEIINIFPKGIVNIHPSLLPKHRGPTPIEAAILEGDQKTGVSLMLLAKEMDAGPILAQKTVHLNGNETKQQLADSLLELGKKLLLENLPKYITGDIKPRKQPHPDRATYSQKLTKENSPIDWTKPAIVIEREIRAFSEWPKSRTVLGKQEIVVTKAHVVEATGRPGEIKLDNKNLVVCTGQASLAIDNLKPAGKPEMTAQAFLAGYSI